MAEILELDNVIINLQDLIKPPTTLIFLSTGTTMGEGWVCGVGDWHDMHMSVCVCRHAHSCGQEGLIFNHHVPAGLCSLLTVSVHSK